MYTFRVGALAILMCTCLFVNGFPQNGYKLKGNAKSDMQWLLKPGKYTVAIMDSVVQTQRQRELELKFRDSVKAHYAWFVEYVEQVPAGKPLPYHINMGLTFNEYGEYMKAAQNPVITWSARETLTITQKDSILYFKGTGKLYVLDSVQVYLSRNIVTVLGFQLDYADTASSADYKGNYKGKWKGYSYFLEFPRDLTSEDFKHTSRLQYTRFKLVIAQLEKTGKTFIDFTALNIHEGQKVIDIKLPLVFQ